MSKIIKEQTLPYDLKESQKIMDKTMVTYKSFANNRSVSEVAFQWKAKISYVLKPTDNNTKVIFTGKNFGYGPIKKNAVQKEIDIFETALRNSIEEITKREDQSNSSNNVDTADEIIKFKDLLDQGILTIEEFDKKKTELLNK